MDFHGAPHEPHLGQAGRRRPRAGDADVTLAEAVTGWRVGDRVIVTDHADQRRRPRSQRPRQRSAPRSAPSRPSTARTVTLDKPLDFEHLGRRRLSRRGRQPEPQRRRRVGRPGRRARPHHVSSRLGRLHQLRRVSPPGQGRRAGPLQPALPPGRRHHARQLRRSAPRSGTAAIAGSPSTAPTTWWSATASATRASATASSWRTAPRSTTSSTATWPCRRTAASRCPSRCCPSTERRRRLLVGQQPQHLHPQRRLRERPATASASRRRQTQRLQPDAARACSPTAAARRWTSARCRSSASRTTKPTATGCTASTSARASTASGRTPGIRSSSAT